MNYYVADTHFGHRNVIKFDDRPFHDIEQMKLELIARWNARVTNDDTVYILGDFCWGKAPEWIKLLAVLNGNKVLFAAITICGICRRSCATCLPM